MTKTLGKPTFQFGVTVFWLVYYPIRAKGGLNTPPTGFFMVFLILGVLQQNLMTFHQIY